MEGKSSFYIQSIDRALKIIDVIADHEPDGVKLAVIADKLELNIATTYRIVKNLVEAQYVDTTRDNSYILGAAFIRLGELVGGAHSLANFCRPILEEAAEVSGQTGYLSLEDVNDHTIYYVDKVAHRGPIQLSSGVGHHNYVHSTANGKVMMSAYPDSEVRDILKRIGMPKLTERTITDPEEYLEQLTRVREDGYALDLEENETNVICVAAPVFNAKGKIIASMSLSGIVGITIDGNMQKYIDLILEYAARVSAKMGYRR